METTLPFTDKEIGKTGTLITSGVFQDDYLSELNGQNKHIIFNKMRKSDTQVKKILAAVINPIKSAKWYIEPVSTDEQDLQVAKLIETILFKDIDFHQKLGEFLTNLVHGFSIFEVVHKNREDDEIGQYTGLGKLAFRSQDTITYWEVDPTEDKVKRIRQQQAGDLKVDVWLDAEHLLIFYNDREGNDNGESLLRPLYGPYKRKLLIETLKMIGIERSAIDTPTLAVPEGVSSKSAEYKAAVEMLENFTSAENSYIIYPDGFKLELSGNGRFDPTKLEDSIKREDEKMAGAILASFLELGTGGNGGAYALGESLGEFFGMVIESFARNITTVINKELIPNLVRLNFGDKAITYPELAFSGITNKAGKQLMETVTGYVKSGVISTDEQLEDYVRKAHNLPKKAEGEMVDNQQTVEDKNDTKKEPNTDGTEENKDVTAEGDSQEKKLSEQTDPIMLANKKTLNLIEKYSEEIRGIVEANILEIGRNLTKEVVAKFKKLSEKNRLDAVKELNAGGRAKFYRQMRGALTTLAKKAFDEAKQEAGLSKKYKLSEKPQCIKALEEIDGYDTVKLAKSDLTGLPTHVRKLIAMQADRLVNKQILATEDTVAFSYSAEAVRTNDYAVIEKKLLDGVEKTAKSPSVVAGSANVSAVVVNQTRNELFFENDVLEQIYAFEFVNFDPKTDICQTMTGTVFSKDDPNLDAYQPPLHHNCKSFISPILVTQKKKPEITGLPTITEKAHKSMTLSERVEKLINLVDTE